MSQRSFQEICSTKNDDELLVIAADIESLTEDAKLVLAGELQRRNLSLPPQSAPSEDQGKPFALIALVFIAGLFLNILIAMLATELLATGIRQLIHPHSITTVLMKMWTLDILCAAGLGLSIYRIWRTQAAVWTWVLPTVWFLLRFVPAALAGGGHSVLVENRGILSQFSGSECIEGLQSMGCRNYFVFTIPMVRCASFSLGALLASKFIWPTKRTPVPATNVAP